MTQEYLIANEISRESHRVGRSTITFLRENPSAGYRLQDGLPTGHCLVDLQRLNTANGEAVIRHVRKYGLPEFGAARVANEALRSRERWLVDRMAELREVHSAEALLLRLLAPYEGALGRTESLRGYVSRYLSASDEIRRAAPDAGMSLLEAKMSLRQLQNAVAAVSAADCFSNPNEVADYLLSRPRLQACPTDFEGGATSFLASAELGGVPSVCGVETDEEVLSMRLRVQALAMQAAIGEANLFVRLTADGAVPDDFGEIRGSSGSYAQAVASQCLETLSLEDGWLICTNPGCQRLYKLHKGFDPASSIRRKRSAYCCGSCRVAAKGAPLPG